jgi:hypothetical protein
MTTQIHANLTVTVDDRYQMQVTGTGEDTLTIHLPDLRAAFSLWRRHRQVLAPIVEQAAVPLDTLNVSLLLVVEGEPVASYRPSDAPGLAARLLGVAPLSLKLRTILSLALRR